MEDTRTSTNAHSFKRTKIARTTRPFLTTFYNQDTKKKQMSAEARNYVVM